MDINQNKNQTNVKVTPIKIKTTPNQNQNNMPEIKKTMQRNDNGKNFYPTKNTKITKVTSMTNMPSNIIPQDSNLNTNILEKMENGEKKIKKIINRKNIKRALTKTANSSSEKKLQVLSINNLKKINNEMIPKDVEILENTMQNKIDNFIDDKNENENGHFQKRAMTPRKKSEDVKLVPFDNIEKEIALEPKIVDSMKKQISLMNIEESQSIFESFFISSLPKEDYSFAEDINNPGAIYCSKNLSQCGHDSCVKLPAYKAGLIFKYPPIEKNPQNFEMSDLVTSLCFPFGIKVCFGKYEKKELIMPKKPSDFYLVTTNGFNDHNYVYVYNFYLKLELEEFKKTYKCDPIKDYLNMLIKNNDRNLQTKFAECQNMINTQYVYIPHTCCLVSKYPYFKEMRKTIYSILKLTNNEDLLITFLKHIIYEIPDINIYKT